LGQSDSEELPSPSPASVYNGLNIFLVGTSESDLGGLQNPTLVSRVSRVRVSVVKIRVRFSFSDRDGTGLFNME